VNVPVSVNPANDADSADDITADIAVATAALPEPASWGLMILGSGMAGAMYADAGDDLRRLIARYRRRIWSLAHSRGRHTISAMAALHRRYRELVSDDTN